MKTPWIVGFIGIWITFTSSAFAASGSVALGKIEFQVDTSVKMFRFTGQAEQLHATLERTGNMLKSLELTIPVDSLKTGMSMRDHHMRERIFTTKDGKTPDIVFKAESVKCDSTCEITGQLTLRGETRPQLIKVTMKDPNHVQGSAQIAISKFGIEDPSQAGVRVLEPVNLNFDVELK